MLLQIPVEDKAAAGRGGTAVQRLGVSRYHPLMLAGTATGTVLLYDLRSPRTAAATLKPHTSPMVVALASVIMLSSLASMLAMVMQRPMVKMWGIGAN